jgi:hypothetical protein
MEVMMRQYIHFANALIVFLTIVITNQVAYGQTYKVVDTGQNKCYDDSMEISPPSPGEPFYGQDAQYDGYQPSYTDNGNGTITDNVTGLTWTKSPDLDDGGDIDIDDKLTFDDALTYPDTLNAQNFGGHSDWRLPSIKELYSLINFNGTDPSGPGGYDPIPFIDTAYFDFGYGDTAAGERIIDAQFWSSNVYFGTVFGDQEAAFGLNLADGRIKGYPTSGPMPKVNYVYFVCGNTNYGVNDFTDNSDGTITDNATGLMWSKDDFGDSVSTGPRSGMIWEDALAWIQQKNGENYLGYSDWRLPNAKEMQSIIDYARSPDSTGSAAIDPVFNITQITNEDGEVDYPWFWTSTTHVKSNGSGDAGAYICFGRAMGYFGPSGMESWLDVHGAGAQRSDRKDGDFSGYIYVPDGYYFPNAPQGDAVRMYNYVRCVRGGLTTTEEQKTEVPQGTLILQNYPNPFNRNTTFSYCLSKSTLVKIRIYDSTGRNMRTLVNEMKPAGHYQIVWDGKDNHGKKLNPGVYFCKLQTYEDTVTVGLICIK